MEVVKVEMYLEVKEGTMDKIKVIEHHAERLLDLESWPEIKSVYGVKVTKQ